MLAAANALEDEYGKVCLDLIEVAAIPISEFPLLIEKCNRPPLAFAVHELGTLDRLSPVEDSRQVGIAESAKDTAQLNEEFPVVSLDLSLSRGCREQNGK